MTLAEQAATLWSPRLFPPVFAFVDGGPLGATPWPWRLGYGLLLMSLVAVPAWLWSSRRLKSSNG